MIILHKRPVAVITKTNAHAIVICLPTRAVVSKRSGLVVQEIPMHWELLTSHGRVVRCHTELEAQEALEIVWEGVERGQFLSARIDPYDPRKSDIPYHEWVRGIRDRQLEKMGLSERALPEYHDPSLKEMSRNEWLNRGPR